MLSSLVKISVIVLTLRLIVIECQESFCTVFGPLHEAFRSHPKYVQFIPTANGSHIYIFNMSSHLVFKFEPICNYGQKCPNIELGQKLTEFTDNRLKSLNEYRPPFLHNGITYLYGTPVDRDRNKIGIKMYANGTTDWIYEPKPKPVNIHQWLDQSIKTYAICYLWESWDIWGGGYEMVKVLLSVFVPPFEPKLRIGSIPRYGFSFDKSEVNDVTVEVKGNYPRVDFVFHKKPYLYTFGDYIVPCLYRQYMLLPNGDAIATIDNRDNRYPDSKEVNFELLYFRSDPMEFETITSVKLWELLGCDGKPIPPKTLTDYKTDNIYSYFNKD